MCESPEERRERHEREAEEQARWAAARTYTLNVNVNVNYHYATDPAPAWARTMTSQLEKLMAVSQETSDAITLLNKETNDLSDRVSAALAKLTDANQTAEDKAAAVAEIQAVAARLHTIAADPANPVPPTP